MPVTSYMGLVLPSVSITLGPEYATENNAAFTTVDSHNHTSGQGIQVPSAGIGIDADLTFGSYNATALRSSRYTANGSALALVTDIGCVYVAGVDLWFNDRNGVQIQLTASGALNAASIGGIGGDYSTSTASVAYSNSSKTFTFLQDTNKSALMDMGTILLRRTDITSSAAITIQADATLSAGWTFTLPTAPPAATQVQLMSSSGALSSSTVTSAQLSNVVANNVTSCATTVFTSSGTWTKATLNPKFVKITVIGAGGGGGGAEARGGSNEENAGAGGGGGGCSLKTILSATLGATETVTIGAGGTAGSSSGGNGGTGGTSSFGAHASSTGGGGGTGMTNDLTISPRSVVGGSGGLGANGDLNFAGSDGGPGIMVSDSSQEYILRTGCGGASYLGGSKRATSSNSSAGSTGYTYGGGASGASTNSATGRAGGVGGAGVVIVEEFY